MNLLKSKLDHTLEVLNDFNDDLKTVDGLYKCDKTPSRVAHNQGLKELDALKNEVTFIKQIIGSPGKYTRRSCRCKKSVNHHLKIKHLSQLLSFS